MSNESLVSIGRRSPTVTGTCVSHPTPPLITTIIPTYRRPDLLRRAVGSVLGQTYPHFQVCIYDNDSGDDTSSVVAELAESDARVKYYCHSENVGAFKNFSFGMERVDTQFFSILSDDDLLLPDFYKTAMQAFTRFPDAMFSAGTTLVVDNENIPNTYPPKIKKRQIRYAFPPFVRGDGYYYPPEGLFEIIQNHLIWTAVLFRRDVIDEVGAFDAEIGPMSDQDFLFRTAARFPLVISPLPCAVFVDHEGAYGHSRHLEVVWPGWLKIIANLPQDTRIPAQVRARAELQLTRRLQEWLLVLGFGALKQNKYEETYEIAEILRSNYNLRLKAFALNLNAKLCQHLPAAYTSLMYSTLKRLNKIRVFLMLLRSS